MKFGFRAFMEEWQFAYFEKIFKVDHMKIERTSIKPPSFLGIQWTGAGHEIAPAGRPNGPTWFPTEDFLNNTSSYLQNKFVNIGFYPNYLWLYKEYLTELRRQLVFKDHLKANWKYVLSRQSSKKVVFVGVHVRRTDRNHHFTEEQQHRFYLKAFEIYRGRYNTEVTEVIFLAVSDDVKWIKSEFSQHTDVRFGVDYSKDRIDEEDLVGFDLCVLASSDHSIYMLGYFGMWGSLLAGGDVVVSRGNLDDYFTEEDDIHMKAMMPGWRYIDSRADNPVVLKIDEETGQFVQEAGNFVAQGG